MNIERIMKFVQLVLLAAILVAVIRVGNHTYSLDQRYPGPGSEDIVRAIEDFHVYVESEARRRP